MKDLNIFIHELCINFENYGIPKEEAERFNEAFAHFHFAMSQFNNEPLMNALWLQDNFLDLWKNHTPKEMLDKCLEHCAKRIELKSEIQKHSV